MPLYPYHCDQCGADIELLIRGAEKPVCSECGGTKLEKLLSAPAAHVAGGTNLPMMPSPGFGGCGKPGCGPGGCGAGM